MVIGTIPVSVIYAYILFDFGATHLFISTAFVRKYGIFCEPMNLCVETPVGDMMSTHTICKPHKVKIGDKELYADLIILDMWDFDVILGMDWLATYHALVDCHKKCVNFKIPSELEFSFMESIEGTPLHIISALQARQIITKGCTGYLATVIDT